MLYMKDTIIPFIGEENMYHYVYRLINEINGCEYIGTHSSKNYTHQYYGSGNAIIEAVEQYGKDNFTKEILRFFNSKLDAMEYEGFLVTNEYVESKQTYNLTNGGTGPTNSKRPQHAIEIDRSFMIKRWQDDYDYMMKTCHNEEAKRKRGESVSRWIKNNQEAHQERMLKINKNPEKIRKMAETHTGMKRSEESKKRMSEAKKLNPTDPAALGKGSVYMTNLLTYKSIRVSADYVLKENEAFGFIKDPKLPLKRRSIVTNIDTWTDYWAEVGYVLSDNEHKGNKGVVRKKLGLLTR